MKNADEEVVAEMKEHFDQRLDDIEGLLKASLLLALSQEVDGNLSDVGGQENFLDRCDDVKLNKCVDSCSDVKLDEYVEKMGLTICQRETYADKCLVFIKTKRVVGIQEIGTMIELLNKNFENIVPVFMFDKLNGIQKKQLLLERFSYCIHNQEIHIVVK